MDQGRGDEPGRVMRTAAYLHKWASVNSEMPGLNIRAHHGIMTSFRTVLPVSIVTAISFLTFCASSCTR